MVSNLGFATLGILLAARVDVSISQAAATAEEFRHYAARAGGAAYVGTAPPQNALALDSDPKLTASNYYFGDGFNAQACLVGVERTTGKVTYFANNYLPGFSEEWDEQHALTDQQLVAFANAYYTHAGYSGPLSLRFKNSQYNGAANIFNFMAIRKLAADIEYEASYDIDFAIEHVTGRLSYMRIPPLPLPPTDTAATASPTQAVADAVLMINQRTGLTSFTIDQPIRKAAWAPDNERLSDNMRFLTQQEIQLGQQNRSKLIYWAALSATQNNRTRSFYIYVDARTGRVMGALDWGVGFGASARQATTTKARLQLKVDGRFVQVTPSQLMPASVPANVGETRRVLFKKGADLFVGLYDRKTRMVLLQKKWYKVSKSLSELM